MENLTNNKPVLVALYSFIVNEEGNFLMVKRSESDSWPGLWELPGGKIEFGEDIKPALIREVKEEVGLDVEVIRPIAVKANTQDDRHLIRISFLVKAKSFDVKLSSEHSEYKWVSAPEGEKISSLLEETFEEVKNSL